MYIFFYLNQNISKKQFKHCRQKLKIKPNYTYYIITEKKTIKYNVIFFQGDW